MVSEKPVLEVSAIITSQNIIKMSATNTSARPNEFTASSLHVQSFLFIMDVKSSNVTLDLEYWLVALALSFS
jgi:hypothetical protein